MWTKIIEPMEEKDLNDYNVELGKIGCDYKCRLRLAVRKRSRWVGTALQNLRPFGAPTNSAPASWSAAVLCRFSLGMQAMLDTFNRARNNCAGSEEF
ncbi:MAG: hypothetical protein C5B50_26355 [Verrucomicrobia bacterium]|nr:MAG: hypothetical protein C5B50_26355 [Verrucomicrobiota bacterium]